VLRSFGRAEGGRARLKRNEVASRPAVTIAKPGLSVRNSSWSEYELDASGSVVYVRTDTAYEQTEAQRAGKAGADAATGTFVFEARKPGTASLQVRALFRDTVESQSEFTITVLASDD
jgi:hypothetical protein